MKQVRERNLGLVLRQVADRGPRSRATLALETGLNKSTVSSLVAELIDAGLLRDVPVEERPGKVGRPPQSVELDPEGPYVLGLEINVDYLAAWACDLAGQVRHREFVTHDNRVAAPDEVIGGLARLADRALEQPFAGNRHPTVATVAVPGLVDPDGELAVAPNLGWVDVPVAALLKEALEDPPYAVRVENEANLGAVAELVGGAGRGLRDFVYVSGEIGIGAGVVLRGELFLAGQDTLLRLAGWDSRMRTEGTRPEWPGAMLARSAREGHSRTLQALSKVGHTLGIAVASLANLLDPEAVLLGGYFAPLAEWLTGPIEAELETRALAGRRMRCRVLPARLGGEAAVRGAVAMSRRAALEEAVALPALAAR
jgi:predicted NBD/HSP70 family sugar kinase